MNRRGPVVVLDGPAGSGKSTVAKMLARALGLPHLDTGAIYRAVALYMRQRGIPPEDSDELRRALEGVAVEMREGRVLLCGCDVTEEIRAPEVDSVVSSYAAIPSVRRALLGFQRDQARCGVVAEGRDMGSVVFPDADVKIFLTASPEERARRRHLQRLSSGVESDYDEVLRQVMERDRLDTQRECSPLQMDPGAFLLDTTGLSLEQVVEVLEKEVRLRLGERA
ncbi:MAG: (d)CMP kinase [Thermanaerothrix sp.]|nr:(d)CMP kinase [Thermanaerothrix sp.]